MIHQRVAWTSLTGIKAGYRHAKLARLVADIREGLRPARDRVTGAAQVVRQIRFHLRRRLKRHRVQVLIHFRQEAEAVALGDPRGFGACLVVGEAFFRRQSRHAYIDARLLAVALRVCSPDLSNFADCRVEQHDIDIVMMFGLLFRPESLERPALHSASTGFHFSQRIVTPSLVAPRSGSPRNSGTASSRASNLSLKMEKSSPAMKSLMTASFLRSPNDFRSPI